MPGCRDSIAARTSRTLDDQRDRALSWLAGHWRADDTLSDADSKQ